MVFSQCQKENRSHNYVSTLRDRPPRPTPLLWSPLRLSSAVGWLVRVCVIRERKKRRLSAPFGSQPVSSGQCMGYCTPLPGPSPRWSFPVLYGSSPTGGENRPGSLKKPEGIPRRRHTE
ncbi:unnamed protein product [Sphagnum troendelagicum]|uniref:Uncharacterized protein n=1 Tax=Sphagnum troendelagicum TaxID=128251 RepID=A0ABP0UTP8_9BRYO